MQDTSDRVSKQVKIYLRRSVKSVIERLLERLIVRASLRAFDTRGDVSVVCVKNGIAVPSICPVSTSKLDSESGLPLDVFEYRCVLTML